MGGGGDKSLSLTKGCGHELVASYLGSTEPTRSRVDRWGFHSPSRSFYIKELMVIPQQLHCHP